MPARSGRRCISSKYSVNFTAQLRALRQELSGRTIRYHVAVAAPQYVFEFPMRWIERCRANRDIGDFIIRGLSDLDCLIEQHNQHARLLSPHQQFF